MMLRNVTLAITLASSSWVAAEPSHPVWPSAPDPARVEYAGEIRLSELSRASGFFDKLKSVLAGSDEDAAIGYPFDLLVHGGSLFMVCQDVPALVEIELDEQRYRLIRPEGIPFSQPISLCRFGNAILVSDSAGGRVYRYDGDKLRVWIDEGLSRPTGLAAFDAPDRLCVVDTGDHSLKFFDESGKLVDRVGGQGEGPASFNYPTFAASGSGGELLVNDTLNYRICRLGATGRLLGSFGEEGDGPGSFARPKGIAADRAGNIYVVDSLFDNIQVFSSTGQLLLVIGSRGARPGEFWSPAGISIDDDLIYVADTFNDRVQILRSLGGGR